MKNGVLTGEAVKICPSIHDDDLIDMLLMETKEMEIDPITLAMLNDVELSETEYA